MKWQGKENLLQLMKDLVAIKSISATENEVDAAKFIYKELSELILIYASLLCRRRKPRAS